MVTTGIVSRLATIAEAYSEYSLLAGP